MAESQLPMQVLSLADKVKNLGPEQHGFAWFDENAAVGHGRGDLAGMIIPAKDLQHVVGMPTSFGNPNRRVIAEYTDPFLQRVVDRGALIVGKTQTSELGMTAYCEPSGYPTPDNPLFPGHTTGGSSGGAAAAVARGLVRAAHGSDGGGSLRVPAASCGLVGIKPPHDSRGGMPMAQGFLTRDIATQIRLLGVTPHSRPLKIGVRLEPTHGDGCVDKQMTTAVEQAVTYLETRGHTLVDVPAPYGAWGFEAFSEVLAWRSARVTGHDSHPIIDWLSHRGRDQSPHQRDAAQRAFDSVAGEVRRQWDVDLVLSPTLAFDPPEHGHFSRRAPEEDFAEQTRWTPWATTFNMTGGAAASLPWLMPGRAPVGLHLGAVHAGLPELLALAAELELAR